MSRKTAIALCCAVMALPAAGFAQNPQPAPPVGPPQVAPPNAPSPPPERIVPKHPGTGQNGSLSDQLSHGKGTLHPPPVDPGMAIQPPAHGKGVMPVIPPPGSPGGNERVVPK